MTSGVSSTMNLSVYVRLLRNRFNSLTRLSSSSTRRHVNPETNSLSSSGVISLKKSSRGLKMPVTLAGVAKLKVPVYSLVITPSSPYTTGSFLRYTVLNIGYIKVATIKDFFWRLLNTRMYCTKHLLGKGGYGSV